MRQGSLVQFEVFRYDAVHREKIRCHRINFVGLQGAGILIGHRAVHIIPYRCRVGPVTPDCWQRVVAFKRLFATNERWILVRSFAAQTVTRNTALKVDRATSPRGATTLWQGRSFRADQILVPGKIRGHCRTAETVPPSFHSGATPFLRVGFFRSGQTSAISEIRTGCGQCDRGEHIDDFAFTHGSLFVSVDKPGFDSVVVIETIWSCMESSHRDQLFSGWLHVTSLICAARLQRYLAPVPPPRHRKSCRRLRKRRLIELRTCPSFSIVRRNFDTGNATAAGPREAADFVPTAALQNVFPGWTRNDRLRFHNKCE